MNIYSYNMEFDILHELTNYIEDKFRIFENEIAENMDFADPTRNFAKRKARKAKFY